MAKKVIGEVKLQIPAGAANPSPPVGPALGQRGVNIMEFCKAFNAATQSQQGMITPVSYYSLCGPIFHLCDEDPARVGTAEKGCGRRKRLQRTWQDYSWESHSGASSADCGVEAQGS